jgi:hypothetical protein
MAEEARQQSESAPPDMKQAHRELADQWSEIASEFGRMLSSRHSAQLTSALRKT